MFLEVTVSAWVFKASTSLLFRSTLFGEIPVDYICFGPKLAQRLVFRNPWWHKLVLLCSTHTRSIIESPVSLRDSAWRRKLLAHPHPSIKNRISFIFLIIDITWIRVEQTQNYFLWLDQFSWSKNILWVTFDMIH